MAPRLPKVIQVKCFLIDAAALASCHSGSSDDGPTNTPQGPSNPSDTTRSSLDTSCLKYSGNRALLFGEWIDPDRDCRNTRAEMLEARSQVPVTGGCTIKIGRWFDLYTGKCFDSASSVEIDHLIPVAEAYRSGAWAWSQEQRVSFYNDTSLLVIASSSANSKKSDKDPSRWLPPDSAYHLEYIKRWARGKRKYGLSSDPIERNFLANYLSSDSLPEAHEESNCAL
jgi:hypothetical protein